MKFSYKISSSIGGGINSSLSAGIPGLAQAADEIKKRVSVVVRTTAFDIQASAQNNAPVDVGLLKNSIFVKTQDYDGYELASAAAKSEFESARASGKTPKGREIDKDAEAPLFDASETPAVTSPLHAIVAVAAKYGYYVELGTSRAPAQPYLYPAVAEHQDRFIAAITAALK